MVQSAIFYMLSGILFIEVSRKKDMRIAIFFIVLYAAVLSFAHQPLLTDDLTREYANLDAVRKYGWSYFNQTNGGLYNTFGYNCVLIKVSRIICDTTNILFVFKVARI